MCRPLRRRLCRYCRPDFVCVGGAPMAKTKPVSKSRRAAKTTSKAATFTKAQVSAAIRQRANSPLRLRDWLDRYFPFIVGPRITYFEPTAGPPNTLVTIYGSEFSTIRSENLVEVGGQPAYVASATATELKVITHPDIVDGPVKVTVGAHTAAGPQPFLVLGYPSAGAGEDVATRILPDSALAAEVASR